MSVEIVVGDDGGNLLSLGDAEQIKKHKKKYRKEMNERKRMKGIKR